MSEQIQDDAKTKGKNNTGENIPVYSIHCLGTNHPLSLSLSSGEEEICTLAQEYDCVKDVKGSVLYNSL